MSLAPRVPAFCAIDTTDLSRARTLAEAAVAAGLGVKIGKEFFGAHGPPGIKAVLPPGASLFLDLKLHDIPNTVAGGIRAAADSVAPFCMNVHAAGGAAMLRAAADAAKAAARPPLLLAVTVLTSLDDADLAAIGVPGGAAAQVTRLAALAAANGAAGVVCAAHEIAALRARHGRDFVLMVPGIRPAGAAADDQKRTMTPREALALGATYLVIGRPITGGADPAAAARAIADELAAEVAG
jgi:orotidine-5'-phosphate decarboxylase